MLFRFTPALLAIACLCSADTLTLRSGRLVNGQYLGGDARHVRMAIGDRVETFDVDDVTNLQFGDGGAPRRLRPMIATGIVTATETAIRTVSLPSSLPRR